VRVADVTRADLEAAVRAAWALDTCDPADAADWSAANPSRGQCGPTALTIQDLLGGDLLIAEVLRADGSRQGVHYWNILPDGTEIDLTREQFESCELIQQPRIVRRPAGLPRRGARQYLLMKQRVLGTLGRPEPDGTNHSGATQPDRDEQQALPVQSREDTDEAWGERPEPDEDDRFYRDRPPHWESG
jgi:hypothetical protein